MSKKALGRLGESYVANFLESKGYRILERNFQGRFFEIDLVASKDHRLSFIEVKTREEFDAKEHYKAVSRFKILKIKKGVTRFLSQNPQFSDFSCNIVVAIMLVNPYSKACKVVIYDYLD